MSKLNVEQIYAAAVQAGFSPQQAVTWTAIAMAESGGNTGALNDQGEHSVGLWQINVAADSARATRYGNLRDPLANARAAYDLSHHGLDMRPWTTTHARNRNTAHDYRHYLPDVEKIIGIHGDGRGVKDYRTPLPSPLPDHSAEHPPPDGQADDTPRSQSDPTDTEGGDRDHDGLTDAFEKVAGTNPDDRDSDKDGISDGREAVRSHTDPLRADTDGDGISDRTEIKQHTDPGSVPGVGGVVGTGRFAQRVRGVRDSDHDGLADSVEKEIGTNPDQTDTDKDGLGDALEFSLGTRPDDADTDHDGTTDGLEHRNGSDPLSGAGKTVKPWTFEDAAAAAADRSAEAAPSGAKPDQHDPDALSTFISAARDQVGDRYVYGASLQPKNDNPTQFDCSSLTAWAAHQAGVELPRTAEAQYRELKSEGMTVSVEKALHTKGALLFYFSREPSGALPAGQAHVAISTGDGRTVEAKGTRYGVGEWSAKGRFNYAAVVPGISDPASVQAAATAGQQDGKAWEMPAGRPADDIQHPDQDRDGLTDAYERLLGTKAKLSDTDGDGLLDGYETTVSHTDPLHSDTDRDGTPDGVEVANGTSAGRVSTTPATGDAKQGRDTDHDGVADRDEHRHHTNPHSADSDHDGLADALELSLGTRGDRADTDGDGISDYLEHRFGTNPLDPTQPFGRDPAAGVGSGSADPLAGGIDSTDAAAAAHS